MVVANFLRASIVTAVAPTNKFTVLAAIFAVPYAPACSASVSTDETAPSPVPTQAKELWSATQDLTSRVVAPVEAAKEAVESAAADTPTLSLAINQASRPGSVPPVFTRGSSLRALPTSIG